MGLRSLHQKTQNKHNEKNDDVGVDVQAEAGKSLASAYWDFSTGTFGHTDTRVYHQFYRSWAGPSWRWTFCQKHAHLASKWAAVRKMFFKASVFGSQYIWLLPGSL